MLTFALFYMKYTQSGVLVLLLRVAQEMYPDGSEEVLVILDLISRLVTFNKVSYTAVFFKLIFILICQNMAQKTFVVSWKHCSQYQS